MARTKSDVLHQPGDAKQAPLEQDRAEILPGGAVHRAGFRSSFARSTRGMRGPAHAASQSFGDQLSRRRVVLSEPREDEGKAKAAEDAECSALGNSFHTGAVAGLFDLLLWSMGKKGMKKIQQAFLEQLADIECIKEEATEDETSSESVKVGERNDEADFDASDREEVLSSCSDKTAKLSKATEDRKWPVVTGQTLTEQVYTQGDLRLSSALVSQFCRRQEAKGCDVRLDLGTLYRADAFPGPP